MIETFGLFWLIVSRTVWCPWVYWGWGWRDSMSAREQVHKTYHSADGCGASVGVLAFTSLFSHYNRETNARFGIFLIFLRSNVSLGQLTTFWKSAHFFLNTSLSFFFYSLGCVILHPDRKTYHDRKGSSRAWSCAGSWDWAGGLRLARDVQEVKLGHHSHAYSASGQSLDRRWTKKSVSLWHSHQC